MSAAKGGPVAGTLEHLSLPEAVGKALRRRILNNELPAETRLVEANLAAEFGVSRGTIRDAMRSLQAEGLIAIVPRRYSVVTRMSPADAEDVCFARWVLEDASIRGGFGPSRKELARGLRLAIEHMSAAARTDDMEALVDSDTLFHELLVEVSGRRRLKDLWSMLNSQMGALMREEMERQGIDLSEAVRRHRPILAAVDDGDLDRLRAELREHYLTAFPADG
ncbi:MAG: GntR family transcriptional regulator [Actinobacteria bacterium]|nr:GntR family transcriptional regulator [Actinomycetota bacterium]